MVIVEFDGLDGLTEENAEELIQELASEGSQAEIAQRETPLGAVDVLAIVQVIWVVSLQLGSALVLLRHALNSLRRGVVVDTTGDEPKISPARSLPRGSVVIRQPDGSVQFTDSDPLQSVAQAVVDAIAKLHRSGR